MRETHLSRCPCLQVVLGCPTLLPPPVVGYYDERRRECKAGQRRPPMVRFRDTRLISRASGLTITSIQEALRMYLQPIKNEDPRLDFYAMYKRETVEYDTVYMQKYNEDLNTTLIFVSPRILSSLYCVDPDPVLRPVCSPQSAQLLSSMSSPSSSQTPANDQKPTSERSSSASTRPPALRSLQRGTGLLRRLSRPRTSYMQAS